MWQDTAKALSQRGVEIYSYGIRPGAQAEQVQSITFRPGNSYLIDSYMLPRPIPTGVTGEERTLLLGKPIQCRKHRPVKPPLPRESHHHLSLNTGDSDGGKNVPQKPFPIL